MKKSQKYSIIAAMLLAMTVVFTVFVRIPFGIGGYVHLGDMVIYLSGCLLPLPYAIVVSFGGALSDVVSGYAIWAPFSLVIKVLCVLCFTARQERLLCRRNVIAPILSVPITVGGYFLSETVLYGSASAALLSAPWNVLQAVVCGVLFVFVAVAADRIKLKKWLSF